MFFEHQNKTEFLKKTSHLNDHEFRELFNLLTDQNIEESMLLILLPCEPYELATLLNHTVFGCQRIDKIKEENENLNCEGDSGNNRI